MKNTLNTHTHNNSPHRKSWKWKNLSHSVVATTAIILGGFYAYDHFIKKDGTEEVNHHQNFWGKEKILLSHDPMIRELQQKFWLGRSHRTKSEQGFFGVHTARVDPFLGTPAGTLLPQPIATMSELKQLEQSGIIVDARNIKNRKFDIANDIIKANRTQVTPDGAKILQDIANAFYRKTGIKMRVTCLSRPDEVNNKLSNSSKNSSHRNADAADISFKTGIKNGKQVSYTQKQKAILFQILKDFDNNGRIVLIEEDNHWHITFKDTQLLLAHQDSQYNNIDESFVKTPNEQKEPLSDYLSILNADSKSPGLPMSAKMIMQHLFDNAELDYAKLSVKQRINVRDNMVVLINYVAFIESGGGQYVNNKTSSAQWPMQFLTKNGNNNHGFSSYQTALRRAMKYYNPANKDNPNTDYSPSWIQKAYQNPEKYGPNALTPEQTIDLFLLSSFYNKERSERLMKVLILGDKAAARKIYELHHTNPNDATRARMKVAEKILENLHSAL